MLGKTLHIWAVIVASGFGFTSVALGDDEDSSCFEREIVLTATTNAPVGAYGEAELETEEEDGVIVTTLEVETHGLSAGTYTVSVTDTTGTNTFNLGTFDVGTSDEDENDAEFLFPDGLNPTNVVAVSVTDSNSVVTLIGHFASVSVSLDQEIVLTATTNAPAAATGKAELEAENEDGVVTAELEVETKGLLDGTYTVRVTDNTGTNTFNLGTFDVGASNSTDEDDDSQDDDDEQDADNHDGDHNGDGEGEFSLPVGLNPMDIASISISDSDSVVVLVGDFSNVTTTKKGKLDATAAVVGGTVAPAVQGKATVRVHTKKGKQTGKFRLIVKGVPALQEMTLQANGVAVGTTSSKKNGKLTVRTLAGVPLTSLKSLVATDAQGNVIFSVNF